MLKNTKINTDYTKNIPTLNYLTTYLNNCDEKYLKITIQNGMPIKMLTANIEET